MIRQHVRRLYRFLFPRMFARQDLKLMLGLSLFEMEERARLLAAAADLFVGMARPVPIRPPFGESMLVLAPHQDDEAIGCGGALALQRRSGKRAGVLLLHDGGGDAGSDAAARARLVSLRNRESEQAAGVLSLEPVIFWSYPDLESSFAEAVDRLAALLLERRVDALFSPFPLDGHPDHRTTARIAAAALSRVPGPVRVITYEVWGACLANVVVPIDEVIEEKRKMLDAFVWANQALDYTNSTIGLNMYRSRLLPAGACRYAECFFELPKDDYLAFMRRLEKR